MGTQVGFTTEDVSDRSVRTGGTMGLLMDLFDTGMFRLVGRWIINTMLHYLPTTSQAFTSWIVTNIVQHGDYALIPTAHGF